MKSRWRGGEDTKSDRISRIDPQTELRRSQQRARAARAEVSVSASRVLNKASQDYYTVGSLIAKRLSCGVRCMRQKRVSLRASDEAYRHAMTATDACKAFVQQRARHGEK